MRHGVVTVVRHRTDPSCDEYRLSIGINISKAFGSSAGFHFDRHGHTGPLYLVNAVGETAALKPGLKTPTADSLCGDVIVAWVEDPKSLTFEQPANPNNRWFVASSKGR